jgi:hypothetical protein
MPNRRLHPREQVSIETRLFLRAVSRTVPPTIIPCRVIDVSETGAKIEIGVHYRLPPRVFLLRDEKGLAWRLSNFADGQSMRNY